MAKLLTTKQYKLDKSKKAGVLSAGIQLSPQLEASRILKRSLPSTCPMSGHCAMACIKYTGRNQLPTSAIARARKTALWYDDRETFLAQAITELKAVQRRAERQNMLAACRPNILSDLPILAKSIATAIPSLQCYDYTKLRYPWKRQLANYHLTYSVSERSRKSDVLGAFAHGINCSVVVDIAKGEPIPSTFTWQGITKPTIDGDLHDLRYLDPIGVYVLLRFKGSKARLAQAVKSDWLNTIAVIERI